MIRTKQDDFTDYQLHVEFATPSEVKGNSQGRGNSGVFLNGVFEIQVLDSFDNKSPIRTARRRRCTARSRRW